MAYNDDSSIAVGANCGLPDLTDPATLGCLLALVREAWADPYAYTLPSPSPSGLTSDWLVESPRSGNACLGDGNAQWSEAAALVAALEAACRS